METDDSHGPATPPHECSEAPDGRERLRTRASARVTPPSPAHGRRRFMHPATQADIELGLTGTPTVFEPVRISGRPVSVRHHCQSACRIGSPRGKTSQRTHCSTAPPTARQRLLPRIWRVPGPRRIARPRDRFRLMVVRSRAICGRLRRSQRPVGLAAGLVEARPVHAAGRACARRAIEPGETAVAHRIAAQACSGPDRRGHQVIVGLAGALSTEVDKPRSCDSRGMRRGPARGRFCAVNNSDQRRSPGSGFTRIHSRFQAVQGN